MASEAQGEGGLTFHPLDQFQIHPLFPATEVPATVDLERGVAIMKGGQEVVLSAEQLLHVSEGKELLINLWEAGVQKIEWYTLTNATMWMVLALVGIVVVFVLGSAGRSLIPSRMQSLGEMAYGFVHDMVEDVAGHDGVKYFPLIFTLFTFILFANMLGLLPGSFTPTTHIAVTAVLGFGVFLFVTLLGLFKHGLHFLGLFWMTDAPLILRPIIAVIEVISYFVRPVSHSIRLAGNIMAGHAVIKVFAAFAPLVLISGIGWLVTPVSILAIVAIYALEVLVAFIQAYVFTILTCVYLKDALHPGH